MENQSALHPEKKEQPIPYTEPRKSFWEANRTLLKSLLIAVLTLVMLIPASFIKELVSERENRRQEVINEVSSKWALAQIVKGPIMIVPYWNYETQADKTVLKIKRNLFVMPDQLNIEGQLSPEQRHRSIYDVTLYRSMLEISGTFKPAALAAIGIPVQNILEHEITLMIGIGDVRGIERDINLKMNEETFIMDAGVPSNELITKGLSKQMSWDIQKELTFSFNLQLKGSGDLNFVPIGKTTTVSITSPWLHPSFEGKFIPSQPAVINDKGFKADWTILQISSGIPGVLSGNAINLDESAFGVRLIQPTDGYAKTQRSVKYALLFISLTFTVFFFIEVLQKKQIHPLQYLLVGLALCVFYTLLLSFTEYTGFNPAYGVASLATVLLIGLYVWGIFRSRKIAMTFTASLAALYGYIFVLIQLEDFALLFGSIGLFILLALIMYYSRSIDWYGSHNKKETPTKSEV